MIAKLSESSPDCTSFSSSDSGASPVLLPGDLLELRRYRGLYRHLRLLLHVRHILSESAPLQ